MRVFQLCRHFNHACPFNRVTPSHEATLLIYLENQRKVDFWLRNDLIIMHTPPPRRRSGGPSIMHLQTCLRVFLENKGDNNWRQTFACRWEIGWLPTVFLSQHCLSSDQNSQALPPPPGAMNHL